MPTDYLTTDGLGASHATLLSTSRSHGKDASRQAVPILYIAGFGRSGSTLLDRLLGNTPGLHSGGELDYVWSQGLIGDRLCSCGSRFSDCPFWLDVARNSFSSLRAHEIDAIERYLRTIVFPSSKMWRIIFRRTRQRLASAAPANFLDITAQLYRGVRDVSVQQVVVDSSKLASYLALMAQVPSADVRVAHLVRDPRAVAHSWLRPQVADPDGHSDMPRFSAIKSAVLWLIMNAAVEWTAWRLNLPYIRVRYEDLVKDPAQTVGQIRSAVLGDTELNFAEAGHLNGENIDLAVAHCISGNPMRFRHGPVAVVEDADWKNGPRSRRAIVATITFPMRWRYGYYGHP